MATAANTDCALVTCGWRGVAHCFRPFAAPSCLAWCTSAALSFHPCSLGMGVIPSLMLLFGSMMLPDTPNSLVQRGRPDEGRKVLQRIRGTDNVNVEVCGGGGAGLAERVHS